MNTIQIFHFEFLLCSNDTSDHPKIRKEPCRRLCIRSKEMTRFVAAVLLLALFERTSVVSGFFARYSLPSSHQMSRTTQDTATCSRQQGRLMEVMALMHHEGDDNEITESASSDVSIDSSRRAIIHKTVVASISFLFYTTISCTKTSNQALAASTIKPEDAYQGLLKAREELIMAAKKYLPSRDFDGMRTFLAEEAVNVNNYESNAQVSGQVSISTVSLSLPMIEKSL